MLFNDKFYEFFSKKIGSGGTGGTGDGDMKKSVYDTNSDGIVDKAENLNNGVDNVSLGQVKTHIEDTSIHSTGDMEKSVYDTNSNGIVDKAEELNNGTDSVGITEIKSHLDNTGENLHTANKIQTDTIKFDNLLSAEDNEVQKALDKLDDHKHENYKQYSGFENRTDSVFGVMTTDEFSISPTSFENGYNIYCGGEKFNIQETLNINLTNDRRIHYIFFNYNSGIPYLDISLTLWDIKNINFSPVAIVFKDGSNYVITDERHSYNRNVEWHDWAHNNIGAMYNSGLTGVFTNTTFSFEQGIIYDEDIRFDTGGTKTTTSLWKRDIVANQMRMERGSTTIYKTNGTNLLWDNNGVETPAGNNTFLVYHVYCSNDPVEPIYTVLPQATYPNISSAENSPKPEIRFSTAEWKLIYRLIYRNTLTPELVEVNDFRAVQTGSPVSIIVNEHNSLVNRDATNSHPSVAISVDSENFINSLLGFSGSNTQELFEYIDSINIGADGTDGISMLSGEVDPTTEGVDEDLYLNLTSYELFKKVSGSWVSQGIIKGTDGIDGYGIWSDNRNPISTDGVDNELFLNLDTYELFKKISGSWVSQGIIKGTDGIDGLDMLSGDIDPTTEGKDNDLYLNLTSYELFKKISGSWVSQGIIKGTDGTTPDTSAFYKNSSISANISGTYNIDLNNAENYFLNVTANTEFSLTHINKDNINQSVTVVFKMDGTGGYVLSTSENIYWKDELPTFNTDPNAINIVTFMSFDKGVTWYGHLVGSNYVNV